MCANLDELEEPEAKASLIWIIGEYAEKIDNADELLGTFLEVFKEESYPVSRLSQSLGILAKFGSGTITNSYSNCQAVLEEARRITSHRPAGITSGN